MTFVNEDRIKIFLFLLFSTISLLTLGDIVVDINESGFKWMHLLYELTLWFLTLIAAIYQFRIISWQKDKMSDFKERLDILTLQNEKLKKEKSVFQNKIAHLSEEFIRSIDAEFSRWNLSRSEKEIALLLIKGLSMKEIATIRNASESTVRQQASQIYKKSDLGGRMELSAYFLDDLLALSKLPT